jgi:hypothetical protein
MSATDDLPRLACPECGEPAIPASVIIWATGEGRWTEDDEADCPGCGLHLAARITDDEDDDGIPLVKAVVVDDGADCDDDGQPSDLQEHQDFAHDDEPFGWEIDE